MIYNKLVRDRIPEIIASHGEQANTRILNDSEYRIHLENKLDEEVREYHESKSLEELTDILEVVFALAEAGGHTNDELLTSYRAKHDERGGFSKRIFLISKK